MARTISDGVAILRMEIEKVLGSATEPLNSTEISNMGCIAELGFAVGRVSGELSTLYNMKKKPFPIKRIPATGPGNNAWEYFNPKVVKLAYTEKPPVNDVKPDAPVNHLKANDFQFDPVPFADEIAPAEVQVPAGVKCITLTVGGVSIKIELQ